MNGQEQLLQMRVAAAIRALNHIEDSALKPSLPERVPTPPHRYNERVANAVRIYCAMLIAEPK